MWNVNNQTDIYGDYKAGSAIYRQNVHLNRAPIHTFNIEHYGQTYPLTKLKFYFFYWRIPYIQYRYTIGISDQQVYYIICSLCRLEKDRPKNSRQTSRQRLASLGITAAVLITPSITTEVMLDQPPLSLIIKWNPKLSVYSAMWEQTRQWALACRKLPRKSVKTRP